MENGPLKIIEVISSGDQGLIAAGWNGPGWYFWDETWAYCHGPFNTHEEASLALSNYTERF